MTQIIITRPEVKQSNLETVPYVTKPNLEKYLLRQGFKNNKKLATFLLDCQNPAKPKASLTFESVVAYKLAKTNFEFETLLNKLSDHRVYLEKTYAKEEANRFKTMDAEQREALKTWSQQASKEYRSEACATRQNVLEKAIFKALDKEMGDEARQILVKALEGLSAQTDDTSVPF